MKLESKEIEIKFYNLNPTFILNRTTFCLYTTIDKSKFRQWPHMVVGGKLLPRDIFHMESWFKPNQFLFIV